MNAGTQRRSIAGPAGDLACAIDDPAGVPPQGVAVMCHPHPLHGGTMDNKVVQTLARAFVQMGWRAVRFNFRGVGGSAGSWDDGQGEVDDALTVIDAFREPGQRLALGGFSFGGYVASQAAARQLPGQHAERLVHGEADDVVPRSAVLDWARPQSLPVTVIPGAGHFFHGQLPLLKQIVTGAWRP